MEGEPALGRVNGVAGAKPPGRGPRAAKAQPQTAEGGEPIVPGAGGNGVDSVETEAAGRCAGRS